MLPAAAAAVEVLDEAVSRAAPWVCLNGIAAALLEQPDRLQVTLPAKGWLHVTTGDEPLSQPRLFESRANLRRARSKGFDQGISSDTLRVQQEREGV